MHADIERLQRLLDDQLDPSEASRLREHLDTCATCQTAFERASTDWIEMDALLRHLDHPLPDVDPLSLVDASRPDGWRKQLASAAMVVVGLGLASVAWAAPGSPIQGWFASLSSWVSGGESAGSGTSSTDVRSGGGMLTPGEDLQIDFAAHPGGGRVRIRLTDDSLVGVQTLGGAASFSDEDEGRRLVVTPLESPTEYGIDVPRSASRVVVRFDEVVIFRKDGRNISSLSQPDSLGQWMVRLVAPDE